MTGIEAIVAEIAKAMVPKPKQDVAELYHLVVITDQYRNGRWFILQRDPEPTSCYILWIRPESGLL